MNNFEQELASKLMEMRRGDTPEERAADRPENRSPKHQLARDQYAEKLKSMRKNIQKAGANPSSLKRIRRKTGNDPMLGDDLTAAEKTMRIGKTGRTAGHSGDQTMAESPPRGKKGSGGAYVDRARGEGELTADQRRELGQEADASKDNLRRKRDTDSGHGAKKTRREDFGGDTMRRAFQQAGITGSTEETPQEEPKVTQTAGSSRSEDSDRSSRRRKLKAAAAEAKKKIASKRNQKTTTHAELSDDDAKEVASARNKPGRSDDLEEHFQSTLVQAILINEIGDTPEGKDRIAKAFLKRKREVDKATETSAKDLQKHGPNALPSSKDAGKLARAELQLQKVGSYMGGRMAGEEYAEKRMQGKGYTPSQKERMKRELGDTGAKAGRSTYDDEFKDAEKDLNRRAKKGKWGPKGKATRAAGRSLRAKSRELNWDQGMPPGQSAN